MELLNQKEMLNRRLNYPFFEGGTENLHVSSVLFFFTRFIRTILQFLSLKFEYILNYGKRFAILKADLRRHCYE